MAIPRLPFLGKRRMQPYVNLSIVFCLYTALQYRSSMSLNFLVFHTLGGISSRPATSLFLIFVSTMSSSCVNCPSLMSCWLLIIYLIGSSVTFGDFPCRFSKCSFHKCIRSYWLKSFSFALTVLFLLLASFTDCHAIRYCPSSTECLIFVISSWMFSVCSFRYTLVSSLLGIH